MLAALLNIPRSQKLWDRWSFDNLDSHNRILAAINAKGGTPLTGYNIDPISPIDLKGWLKRHATMHEEANSKLSLQSNNLLDVNLQDEKELTSWIELHHQEHRDLEMALGI